MASSSRLAIWSFILLLGSSAVHSLGVPRVQSRDGDWDYNEDEYPNGYDGKVYGGGEDWGHVPKVFDVNVGPNGLLVYDPPYIQGARPGDKVQFHFNPKNHTVTQSSFYDPCSPLDGGFKTGFVPVEEGTYPLPVKVFEVPEDVIDNPLWFYCGQVNHCQSGMVFSVNAPHPPAENSFEAFKAKAIASAKPAYEEPKWHHKPAVHNVYVGPDNQLVYSPHNVHAKVGDTIRFHFNPKNHTVTQSSFEHPCNPLDGGFKTGFIPVEPGTNPLPYRDLYVEKDGPMWFYCGQVNHCQSGMVFAINAPHPPAYNSFDAFKARAIESGKPMDHAPAMPKVHDVQVGPNDKLVYEPAYVHAQPGEIVRFHFNPKNHTVTQSSFDAPCTPLADGWGFKTGFIPVQPGMNPLPTKDFVVPEGGHPLWFYCGQVNHCPSGMVFAINPPAEHNTFDKFLHNAKATANMHHNNMPSSSGSGNWDNNEDLDAFSDNLELDATSVSSTGETLKSYAIAGLALLGLNALLALVAVVVAVLIYVKRSATTKVATMGAGRYAPVFEAGKVDA